METVLLKALIVGTEDKSLIGFNSEFIQTINMDSVHTSPIYTVQFLDENLLASGDDDGAIKIWDLRTLKSVYSADDQLGGTTTDIKFDVAKNFMLATNSGGHLGVYDLRKNDDSKEQLYALSDEMEEEMTCMQICQV